MRALLPTLVLLTACSDADLFRVVGFQQEAFTNNADILFVIDNSGSMVDENAALVANLDAFIEALASDEGSSASDGLPDAVDNYIDFAAQRTSFINFHIGVTSTDVATHYGALFGTDPVVAFGEDDVVDRFSEAVSAASNIGGAGNEEGLEAVFMAMCRAVDDPPEACFEEINQLTRDDIGSNEGLIRERSAFVPVIISDEGDVSRRREGGLDGTPDNFPDEYDVLFDLFDKRMGWAVIGPEPGICEGGTVVPSWSADRYEYFVNETNGIWRPITQGEPGCAVTDFAAALAEIGELINRLLDTFPLQAIPDPSTILVFVDGHPVDRAPAEGGGFGDGWSYDPEDNSISFHGSAVPDYGAEVQIYYLPLSGQPRDLPF